MKARTWAKVRHMEYSAGSYDPHLPVAVFDFDSTLHPHRGRGPPAGLTRRFLTHLSASFNLVIVSNQSGGAVAAIRNYVAELDAELGDAARVTVYVPMRRDRDRKPHTGAWDHYTSGIKPSFAFYCGDAAGRPGDHAATDYMFALNTGLAFVTPETLFGGSDLAPWDVRDCAAPRCILPRAAQAIGPRVAAPRSCAIMVGSPASGKSRIAAGIPGVLVSNDVQGAAGSRHVFAIALKRGDSVVIDNTNPAAATRAEYARRAGENGYSVTIYYVETPKEICFHLNAARCQLDISGATMEVPPVAIHTYWKRLETPTDEEAESYGGGRLICVPFALAEDAPREVTEFRYPLS